MIVKMRPIKSLLRRQLGRKYSVELSNYKLASYQHDQCERSLRMHLFSMEKKDLALILVLMAAIGLLCMILATLAPQSRILETVLIGESEVHRTIGANKSAPSAEIDMDLEPPNSHRSLSQVNNDQLVPSTTIMDKVETHFLTNSMNSLNREMNILAQIEFGLQQQDESEISEFNINYLIGWQIKALIASRDEANESMSGRKLSPSAEWGEKLLNITFVCRPLNKIADEAAKKQHRFRCLAPEMSANYRIEHLDKRAYILNMSISDMSLVDSNNNGEQFTTNPLSSSSAQNGSINSSSPRRVSQKSVSLPTIAWIGLKLTLGYSNATFTFLTILARLIFLLVSLSIACCFIICLSEHSFRVWSLEQKWTALLLLLLVGANKPMYTFEFLVSPSATSPAATDQLELSATTRNTSAPIISVDNCNSSADNGKHSPGRLTFGLKQASPRNHFDLLDSILELNFICCLLLSWSCFAHSIRQMSRPFFQFYAIKLAIVGSIWMIGVYALISNGSNTENAPLCRDHNPEQRSSPNEMLRLVSLDLTFYLALIVYFANLIYHFGKSALELRPMSYFTLRYRIQLLLCAWMLLNSFLLVFMVSPLHRVQIEPSGSPDALIAAKRQRLRETGNAHEYLDNGARPQSLRHSSDGLRLYDTPNGNWPNVGAELSPTDIGSFTSADLEVDPDPEAQRVACQGNQCQAENESGASKRLVSDEASGGDSTANSGRGSSSSLLVFMPQTHSLDSPCSFLCYIMLINLYVFISAYFYWPVQVQDHNLPS